MRRRLIHPYASLALLALLLADAWFLPYHAARGGYSTAGNFIHRTLLSEPYPNWLRARPQMSVIRGQSLRLVNPETESMDEISRARVQIPSNVLDLTYSPMDLKRGFWAPTRRTLSHHVQTSFGENFTPEERAQARRMFVEASGAADLLTFKDFQTLTTTDIDRQETLPLGYLHNAAAAVALILFLVSLAWLPRAPAYIRAKLGAHRLAAGLCPKCRYNLRGLHAPRCPECGAELPSSPNGGGGGVLAAGGGSASTSPTAPPT